MARTARRFEFDAGEDSQLQASFDFLPEEMRHRRRFGTGAAADWAQRRAQLRLIDRQMVGLGSRIAAARLREILKPAEQDGPSPEALAAARAELRELGSAVFYFGNREEDAVPEPGMAQQRLHPRPLPARYFDAPSPHDATLPATFPATFAGNG
ncbi:hypothetical protein [Dongia sp.]|uniref:hypothetical protein n=1 Tax=Dongia sp. TaxID=1977262 RepID=UPI0035B4E391